MNPRNENALAGDQGAFKNRNPGRLQSHSTAPLELLLSRLENVKPAGSGFRADCPLGHKSRGTLSLRNGDEGQAKIHCFAGCDGLEILHAVGLELRDLFPDDPAPYVPPEKFKTLSEEERKALKKERRFRRLAAQQCKWAAALGVLQFEARVIQIAAVQVASGEPLNTSDHMRLDQAVERVVSARLVLNG